MIPLLFALVTVHLVPSTAGVAARQPQLASDGRVVGLTYGEGGAIYFAASRDGGKSFAPRVKVAEAPMLMLGRHRGPRIAFAGKSVVITAVTGPKAGEADLYAWHSTDGGAHWSKAARINDVAVSAREGLDGLAGDAKGRLFVAWLDHRGEGMELWGAQSVDGGATWSRNAAVYASPDGHICECCHPSVAMDGAGQIVVMWRNWLGGSRDMYLAQSADGVKFSKAMKLGTGTWPLIACPMDGGGLAVQGAKVATVWRRMDSVYLAVPGQAETKLGEGKDAALAWDGEHVRAVWTEGTKLRTWSEGKSEVLAETGAYASAVSLAGGGVVVAWEEKDGVSVARLGGAK